MNCPGMGMEDEMTSQETMFWARELYEGATVFNHLEVGDRFRFPKGDRVYVKTSKTGWIREETSGSKFRTGRGTAVHRVDKEAQNELDT